MSERRAESEEPPAGVAGTGATWPRRAPGAPVSVLAHRGGAGPWRENTLEAFAGALALGAHGVELDVRRSADGVAVVHHDAEVDGLGPISATPAGALPPWLPRLREAMDCCAAAAVNVELKLDATEVTPEAAAALAEAVAPVLAYRSDAATGAVVMSSFWPQALEALGSVDDRAPLALLVHPAFDAEGAIAAAAALGCVALHPHVSAVSPELVAAAHEAGLAVTTWTVNEPADLDRALGAGVDGVVTDTVASTLARCHDAGPPG